MDFDVEALGDTIVEYEGIKYLKFNPKDMNLTQEPGCPELPVKYIRLLVPTYAGNFSVSFSGEAREERSKIQVFPAQKPVTVNEAFLGVVADFTLPNTNEYKANVYSPVAYLAGEGFIDGDVHVISVAVCPVSYNPTTGFFKTYSSLTISVEFDDEISPEQMPVRPVRSNVVSASDDISKVVENAEQASVFCEKRVRDAAVSSSLNEMPQPRYYIVTLNKFKNGFKNLMVWKAKKGYKVIIKTVEELRADHSLDSGDIYSEEATDYAGRLRQFLRNEYESTRDSKGNSLSGPFFLLIGGDATNSPVFSCETVDKTYLGTLESTNMNIVPTDWFFSDLNTSWKKNRTGYYDVRATGTIDFYAEIYVGRIMCTTLADIRRYTAKLINYESYPGNGDFSYLSNCFYTLQDNLSGFKQVGKYISDLKDSFNSDNIKGIEEIVAKKEENKTIYDVYPEGRVVISEINTDKYGFVNLFGHGTPFYIITSTYTEGERNKPGFVENGCGISSDKSVRGYLFDLSLRDYDQYAAGIYNLTNIKPFVAFSIACCVSPFDIIHKKNDEYYKGGENIGKAITTSYENGAVSFLSNTRSGLATLSSTLGSEILNQLRYNKKIGIVESFAKTCVDVPIDVYSSHAKLTHHVIGDPEMDMWLKSPNMFSNVRAVNDGNSYNFTGNEISGALIGLSDGLGRAKLFKATSDNISISDNSFTNPFFTIYKEGFLPEIIWMPTTASISSRTETREATSSFIGLESFSSSTARYVIETAGKLKLDSRNYVKLNRGFEIKDKGAAEIHSNAVSVGAVTVRSGGTLEIHAKSAIIDKGFSIEAGGRLIITNN